MTDSESALSYSAYLAVDELLGLQRPRSEGPEHDELLFIVIHQVYELWFKQMLHELDYAASRMRTGEGPRVRHTLKRVLTILKLQVAQLDILETMTPLEFLSFRDRLESASGFQSVQFRELEFVLGHKRRAMLEHFPRETEGWSRLDRRFSEPTLWDAFLAYLSDRGYSVPASLLERDVTGPVEPSPELQDTLIEVYRNDPDTAGLCERLVDLDEGMQEWRYRHVKMVQRTIGMKRGTGGSAGIEYLNATLVRSHPLFPDLWAIRTRL